jgi:hypothetical protein
MDFTSLLCSSFGLLLKIPAMPGIRMIVRNG